MTKRDSNGKVIGVYNIRCMSYDETTAILEKLAHYEELEEAGRLVEVIRCKDCTRCWKDTIYNRLICEGHIVQPNDYCSYAVDKLAEMEVTE